MSVGKNILIRKKFCKDPAIFRSYLQKPFMGLMLGAIFVIAL